MSAKGTKRKSRHHAHAGLSTAGRQRAHIAGGRPAVDNPCSERLTVRTTELRIAEISFLVYGARTKEAMQ